MHKVILLTGGNRGLGLEIKKQLYHDTHHYIVCMGRTVPEFETDYCLDCPGDITKSLDRKNIIDRVINKWGKIDVLINNAGIVDFKSFLLYTEEDYNNIFKVNVEGTYFITQEIIRYMLTQHSGYIINIGSTRAITGAPNKSLYSMSKFALRSMTQCINSEFKSSGIYSTIVCPGSFDTVPKEAIAKIIKNLIELPIEAHVPEIIIGGVI